MFIVQSYPLAIFFCFVTMLCWGSWGNTQKLAAKTWRYELFYWDYVIGLLLFSLLSAFTLGSFGTEGRSFLDDLMQAAIFFRPFSEVSFSTRRTSCLRRPWRFAACPWLFPSEWDWRWFWAY